MSPHRIHCLELQRRRDGRREKLLAFFVATLALAPWALLPGLA
jgi:hypothetical protein